DADGLTGASINYQWQKLVNGTWSNISGATNQTLNLDNTLLGQQIRVNTVYTDVLGGSENIFSPASNPISDTLPAQTFFTPTVTPVNPNFTDGIGVDYELGMRFTPLTGGYVHAIRYYKSPSETGTHVGRIWSSTGQLLASVNFTNETASGWQEQVLATPLTIAANQTYVVSVNANSYYASSTGGFANPITNGSISTGVGAGVYNETVAVFPNASYQNENYYRDIVFTPANNHPGSATISGTVQEDQIVTANVVDTDGANGAAIAYQWQQLENNTWSDIAGATKQTFTLGDRQVAKQVRVKATYTDALGVGETVFSNPTSAVINVNDQSLSILRGSATVGQSLIAGILDDDGLGATINYQWQQLESGSWNNIAGATSQTFTLTNAQINKQVRATATYTDGNNTFESVATSGTTVAALNPIVVENQKQGTTAWQIANLAANNEIAGYAGATSVNQGEVLPIKVSLAQPGQYKIDVYRLGYYGGAGGRLITSSGLLNGTTQSGPIFDPNTRLVEYNWNTSYNLQVGNDWTSGLYIAEMTDIRTGKESQVWFAVRDDDRPADLGFQASFTTYEAYNNYGGYSTYTSNSIGEQRAFKVSFNRPMAPTHQGSLNNDGYNINNMIAWEYNMVAWLESQGYDVSYYTNLDVHTNPLQLFSQKTFLSVGHDEYWSMEMFDNIEKARDNGINLGFFSANTAYWRVRFEPSSTGEPNRVMVSYKSNWALDPVAQNDISQATTVFRSPELNRPENSLLGVAYIGNTGSGDSTGGFDWVVSNSSDPYYAHTGLKNGDILTGLVGYEWDAVLNNGFSPSGLVVLSQSPVTPQGSLPLLPPGTNLYISNGVRYTAPSGAKVFSTGTIQWPWGLYGTSRTDPRVKQITANVLADMGAKPQTPSAGLIV
ncbi:MAG TPA: N,N-dimethylformamidase beta subunit family domain-containing protein, partial [Leptolyngbyaceae cyanobacterium]